MSTIRIKGGHLIDPQQGIDEPLDLWLSDDKVHSIGREGPDPTGLEIDATGLIVCPGLIDPHVHLREPGNEEDETIATGAQAALAGGLTTVACMPNTIPPLDTPASVEYIVLQAKRAKKANVYPVGAVSKERSGGELAELGLLASAGAVAFTDDGAPVADPALMRRALQYARMFDRVIMQHCQVMELTEGGIMNGGFQSNRLGLPGMPPEAEDMMVARDIRLAEVTGGRLHIQHISTARAVELVRDAKNRGVAVTAEACPHHFTLTDDALESFDANYKMNPPLRTATDVVSVIEGLKDGTIEVLCTDHAPHAPEKKERELNIAPFGIIGVETLLPLVSTALVRTGHLSWSEAIRKLTEAPAKLLGLHHRKGTLKPGFDADVTLFDPHTQWSIDPDRFYSKSRNCPFGGWEVFGRARIVIVHGEVRYVDSSEEGSGAEVNERIQQRGFHQESRK